jgi:hypothetical protein
MVVRQLLSACATAAVDNLDFWLLGADPQRATLSAVGATSLILPDGGAGG